MIRLLVSVSLLMFLSLAAAQPIQDYDVVCRADVSEEESGTNDTAAIEVDDEEDGDEVIGVASNVNGTWHVSLDRDANCDEGEVVLVPYGDEEDTELHAEVTDEDGSSMLTIHEPVEYETEGTDDVAGTEEDGTSETTHEGESPDEPTEVEANEVPDVAIEGKRRARENRNEAWDGRGGRPDWAGGDDEEDEDAEVSEESEGDNGDEEDAAEPPDAEEVAGERDENGERRGPPDFAGPPNGDGDQEDNDDDEDEDDDDDDRGPPEGRGGPPGDGAGPPDAPERP
ncbi:MAG: hypothetical protein U5K81_10265 [Trueperaceae bacterium]|nr:hypothetical protein [Trueperaceae bacterium]